ncbi:maleylacetoacetate isomerase [Phialophora macrospora]|uniref:Maleylacetoacetate isomerase n=1 Tax=Phialophora macrospora TaxID=1851006 RepID=A0A0D2FR76_9EURO|nr:maleylacetoacetate isomerase [Phialophora macrospora]
MSVDQAELVLYTFFRSTSTARVRTAARLKNIQLHFRYVNVRKDEQFEEEFLSLNPNGTVPVLTVTTRGEGQQQRDSSFSIKQSVAILEFFEEAFPGTRPLLPPMTDLFGRAYVRDLVNLVAGDIQPPTNRRILLRVKEAGLTAEEWAFKIMFDGLRAFDEMAKPLAGLYSYGNTLTLADVVLAPAVENAVRYGVNLEELPTVKRIFDRISGLGEFQAADWRHQEDTPPEEIKS